MNCKIKPERLKINYWSIVLGIVMLGYVTLRFFLYKEDNSFWNYWYILFYIPAAIIIFIDGSGYTFGKYTININDDAISVSSGLLFSHKQVLKWNDITEIEIQKKRLFFKLKENKNSYIQTSRIPDETLNSVIEAITKTAKEKGIYINNVS
ncbi:MAG: hypothetical protein GXO47_12890 [Chlorobi bacterium]|nr:hypothetical protein [Chlorobiota bacterium]